MCTFVYVYPEVIWVGLLSMLASAFTFHAQHLRAPLLPTFHSSMLLHIDEVLLCPFLDSRLSLLSCVLGCQWGQTGDAVGSGLLCSTAQ